MSVYQDQYFVFLVNDSCSKIFTESAFWAGSVIELPCPCICACVPSQNTHFWVLCTHLVKEHIPNIGLWWHNFHKKGGSVFEPWGSFFPRSLKCTVLDQPTVDNGGVRRPAGPAGEGLWLWRLAVGCWHFNRTSTALQRHFNNKSTARYCCFYLHQLRESVSPVCGILFIQFYIIELHK